MEAAIFFGSLSIAAFTALIWLHFDEKKRHSTR
jgi:hypothetical protein